MKSVRSTTGIDPAGPGNEPSTRVRFGPYLLDRVDQRLWNGEDHVPLPPKAFDLLSFLVARPGLLATKEDLLDGVWPDTYVSDAVLKVTVGELRRALGDSAQAPHWIQTVHRRGYRFIADVEGAEPSVPAPVARTEPIDPDHVVGRRAMFEDLFAAFAAACSGDRRTVFLTGPPGVGKTAVVDCLVAHQAGTEALVAHGQCRESYGEGEAYLPILEAVGGLCRGERAPAVMSILRRHAPSWLLQMPWVLDDDDRRAVEEAARHVGRERMLREIADGLEELSRDCPLLLILEDLHWSDPSTVDVLSTLAQRTSPARLLIVATYRPIDAVLSDHPVKSLKQDLVARGRGVELPVQLLGKEDIGAYVEHLLSVPAPPEVVDLIHRRTEGNALFMTTLVSDLVEQGCVERVDDRLELRRSIEEIEGLFPDELKQILERHVERLAPESLRLLECASVIAREFNASMVAALLGDDGRTVEDQLEMLGRGENFVRSIGVERSADGSVTGRYEFGHVLHRHALYDRLGKARRAALHAQVAEILEKAGAGPAQLAYHYHAGGRTEEAIENWHRAGDVAMGRKASVEAIAHCERALSLLAESAASEARDARELTLLTVVGPALGNVYGHGAPRVEEVYARARDLAGRAGGGLEMMGVLAGLFQFYVSRARCLEAREVAEQLRLITDHETAPLIRRSGLLLCGVASTYLGEIDRADEELERTLAMADGDESTQWGYLADGQACAFAAQVHHLRGDAKRAVERADEAIALGVVAKDPFAQAIGLHFASVIHRWRRDVEATRESATRLREIADEHGFEVWRPVSRWTLGWVEAESGDTTAGLEAMRAAMETYRQSGNETARTDYLGTQATVCLAAGAIPEGIALVEEALEQVERSHERFHEAELHRIRAALLASGPDAEKAAECAIEISRAQGARALELRALVTLCTVLGTKRNAKKKARDALARLYDELPSDLDTPDRADARRVLGRDEPHV